MSLLDDAQAAGPDLWWNTDDLALSGTYKAGGIGQGETVPVLLGYGGQPEVERSPVNLGAGSRYLPERLTALLPADQVANPQVGDTLTLGSAVWSVRQVKAGNRLAWEVELVKDVRVSH